MPLEFDSATHTYRLDGVVVPSVTEVLKVSGLYNHAGVLPDVLEAAGARGHVVHEMLAWYDQDDLDETTLDAKWAAYLNGWKAFRADTKFAPAAIEERCVSATQPHYAGTLDRTGTAEGVSLAVVDIKTGRAQGADVVQVAAYLGLLPAESRPVGWLVYLHPALARGYKLLPLSIEQAWQGKVVFNHALAVFNWRREHGLLPKQEDDDGSNG